jgi:hypothetical protein
VHTAPSWRRVFEKEMAHFGHFDEFEAYAGTRTDTWDYPTVKTSFICQVKAQLAVVRSSGSAYLPITPSTNTNWVRGSLGQALERLARQRVGQANGSGAPGL